VPLLLALSASSPFSRGVDSGLASARLVIGSSVPHTGTPPAFASFDEFSEVLARLGRARALPDASYLWWDVRPHPRLGTLELRIPDAQFDLEASLALAAYAQALVAELIDEIEQGHRPVSYHRQLVAENRWAAGRHGLDAPLLDLVAGRREKVGARELVARRLKRLAPYARDLGSLDALRGIERILADGTGAERQLRVWQSNRDLLQLLSGVCDATEMTDSRALA
jgi:glutamate---cysteine ligase / carboxylate-amine ligase